MQCKDRHFIYTINKRAILKDIDYLDEKKILKKELIEKLYNGDIWNGIDKFFTGKEYVYYDKSPADSTNKLHKKLYHMGYFDFNEVGCGKCEICKTEKSKDWATKAWCENQMWKNACFITLTYNNENLPKDRKLKRSDIQKFWKDLRYHLYKKTKKAQKVDLTEEKENLEEIWTNEFEDTFGQNKRRKNRKPIRYINCGEYGPKTKRPHYHAVIWNFKPMDLQRHYRDRRGYWLYTSKKLNKIWGKGFVIIGNATTETAAYVARYCTKKYTRTEEEQTKMKIKKQQEFIGASSLGFIGYYYWIKFKEKIKQQMGILMKAKDHTFMAKLPKIMQKKWKEEDYDSWLWYDYIKCKTGKENWEKILSKTDLSESEYIEQTYQSRMRKLAFLTRSKGDLIN